MEVFKMKTTEFERASHVPIDFTGIAEFPDGTKYRYENGKVVAVKYTSEKGFVVFERHQFHTWLNDKIKYLKTKYPEKYSTPDELKCVAMQEVLNGCLKNG